MKPIPLTETQMAELSRLRCKKCKDSWGKPTKEQVVQWAGSVVGVTDEILTYYSLDADELVKFTDLARADLETKVAGLQKTNAELNATFKEETAKKWADLEATIAEQEAELESLRKHAKEVSEQTPEKPDYWSSCSQCERNASTAEDLIAAAPKQEK